MMLPISIKVTQLLLNYLIEEDTQIRKSINKIRKVFNSYLRAAKSNLASKLKSFYEINIAKKQCERRWRANYSKTTIIK